MKQIATNISILVTTLMFSACHDPFESTAESGGKVNYSELFPVNSIDNSWYFSDASDNKLSISIADTISDGHDHYFKAKFSETGSESERAFWFLMNGDEFLYSSTLRGNYKKLLPTRFLQNGGSFEVDGCDVIYKIHDRYNISNISFKNVVDLYYSGKTLDGFSDICFANQIGPIQFTDDRGRWPITYNLDSARIDGDIITGN